MGKRGPKPTPTKILEAKGSRVPASRRNEAKPPSECASAVRPPSWLHGAIAHAQWRAKCKRLAEMGILAKVDGEMLALWCQSMQDYVDAQETIRRSGRYVETAKGNLIIAPAVRDMRESLDRIAKLSKCFGFSPADRVGLDVETETAEDEFSAFVARKHAARG